MKKSCSLQGELLINNITPRRQTGVHSILNSNVQSALIKWRSCYSSLVGFSAPNPTHTCEVDRGRCRVLVQGLGG